MLLHGFLEMIYQGTFGVFSLVLVIVLALGYGMERNETVDKVALYIIVALGSYGVQLNFGGEDFSIGNLGVQGCFTAMFIALVSCHIYRRLRKVSFLTLRKYAVGMEGLCANAIQALLPMAVTILLAAAFAKVLHVWFGVYNLTICLRFILAKCSRIWGIIGTRACYILFYYIFFGYAGFMGAICLSRSHRLHLLRCLRKLYSVKAFSIHMWLWVVVEQLSVCC